MSNLNNRLIQLEKQSGAGDVKKYCCVIGADHKESEGYTVTDFGNGGNPQHFATRAALDGFDARPDVDLLIVKIKYASEAQGDKPE